MQIDEIFSQAPSAFYSGQVQMVLLGENEIGKEIMFKWSLSGMPCHSLPYT